MFIALLVVATILSLVGIVLFLVDAFRIHWGWGLASLCIPFACLVRHWSATKRGFIVYLFAIFKALESEFATLAAKRKTLPKKDSKALAAYNLEAKNYTEKLAATRAEQENLIALSRGVAAK